MNDELGLSPAIVLSAAAFAILHTVGDREVSDTVEAQTALILVNATRFAFKPGPRNYDRTWIRDGSSQTLALLWAGLIEEAKDYVLWYSKRIYPNGLVPPILNVDGTVNKGYGSDIEFDAQGEFVGIAADVYRVTRDPAFLSEIFEPVVRATKFIDELCAGPTVCTGRRPVSTASWPRPSAMKATASPPTATGTITSRSAPGGTANISRARSAMRTFHPARKRRARRSPPTSPARSA